MIHKYVIFQHITWYKFYHHSLMVPELVTSWTKTQSRRMCQWSAADLISMPCWLSDMYLYYIYEIFYSMSIEVYSLSMTFSTV